MPAERRLKSPETVAMWRYLVIQGGTLMEIIRRKNIDGSGNPVHRKYWDRQRQDLRGQPEKARREIDASDLVSVRVHRCPFPLDFVFEGSFLIIQINAGDD
jgi:hypothetical protein